MSAFYHNITGELTTELITPGDRERVSSVTMANVHGTLPCSVDLFVEKIGTGRFYYFKGLVLPANTSVSQGVSFDNNIGEFGLYIKLTKSASETPAVDVIL